jgi:hypothetical protein
VHVLAEKTVIVVGAGASVEADLPTGEGLIPKIADYLGNTRGEVANHIRYAPPLIDDRRANSAMLEDAAKRISKGLWGSFSIDNFIDENRGDKFVEQCGKLAIAKTILDAENASKMRLDDNNIYNEATLNELRGTWYTKLSSLIFEGCTKADLVDRLNRITFIIFNYDRCVEHYLFWALRLTYGLAQQEAASLMNEVRIHHPYGTVGLLPWQSDRSPVAFGNPSERADIWSVVGQIKTFTEGIQSEEHTAIQDAMFQASMVIFLGFAYHNLNMFLLTPAEKKVFAGEKRYFGTVFGRSKSDIGILEGRLQAMWPVNGSTNVDLADCKCSRLFDEYHATFTMDPS